MGNKGLDVVQVKLVMDKTLYSEEQLSSPDQVVQFMRKELSEYDREVFCILNCTTKSQVINMNIVSMGTINESLVTGRKCLKVQSFPMRAMSFCYIIIRLVIRSRVIMIFWSQQNLSLIHI